MFSSKSLEDKIMLITYKIFRSVRKHSSEATEANEPSMLQLQAMLAVSLNKTTMSEIAQELHIALPTATVLIERLVKAEYVVRGFDENDRRIIKISLTSLGREILQKTMKQKLERTKYILDLIPKDDKKTLLRILQNLQTALELSEDNVSSEQKYIHAR